ncbi:MAG: peptidoglycan editing factor PgeF [Syntrophobacteraceae bacterium]
MDNPVRVTFPLLSSISDLAHGVFTRHGGVSLPPFDTLNVAFNGGDDSDAVRENLLRIRRELGGPMLVFSRQIHGDTINIVDEAMLEQCASDAPYFQAPPGDALVTRLQSVALMVKVADCQAILLVDPVREVIANVHSGWRGSVRDLAGKTVGIMQRRFGCNPKDVLAAVSPSLGPCCGEFIHYESELPAAFWPFQVHPRHFDFWAITRAQLAAAGLLPEHIDVAGRCTRCEAADFFSYRGEKITGRMAAVLAWNGAPAT